MGNNIRENNTLSIKWDSNYNNKKERPSLLSSIMMIACIKISKIYLNGLQI